jgi:hypothetical protein
MSASPLLFSKWGLFRATEESPFPFSSARLRWMNGAERFHSELPSHRRVSGVFYAMTLIAWRIQTRAWREYSFGVKF